jgi:hypothetical protein
MKTTKPYHSKQNINLDRANTKRSATDRLHNKIFICVIIVLLLITTTNTKIFPVTPIIKITALAIDTYQKI